MASPTLSRPIVFMLVGQFVIAIILIWALPISKASEVKNVEINLTLGKGKNWSIFSWVDD